MIRVGTASPFSQVGQAFDCGQNNNGQVCDFRCEVGTCAKPWAPVQGSAGLGKFSKPGSQGNFPGLGNVNTESGADRIQCDADCKKKNKAKRVARMEAAYAQREKVCGGQDGCLLKPITIPASGIPLMPGYKKEAKTTLCCYGLK
jgi:hypothetical protein